MESSSEGRPKREEVDFGLLGKERPPPWESWEKEDTLGRVEGRQGNPNGGESLTTSLPFTDPSNNPSRGFAHALSVDRLLPLSSSAS